MPSASVVFPALAVLLIKFKQHSTSGKFNLIRVNSEDAIDLRCKRRTSDFTFGSGQPMQGAG